MADPIRTAVVGTGYFGRFHANHYAKNPRAKLVAQVGAKEHARLAIGAARRHLDPHASLASGEAPARSA